MEIFVQEVVTVTNFSGELPKNAVKIFGIDKEGHRTDETMIVKEVKGNIIHMTSWDGTAFSFNVDDFGDGFLTLEVLGGPKKKEPLEQGMPGQLKPNEKRSNTRKKRDNALLKSVLQDSPFPMTTAEVYDAVKQRGRIWNPNSTTGFIQHAATVHTGIVSPSRGMWTYKR